MVLSDSRPSKIPCRVTQAHPSAHPGGLMATAPTGEGIPPVLPGQKTSQTQQFLWGPDGIGGPGTAFLVLCVFPARHPRARGAWRGLPPAACGGRLPAAGQPRGGGPGQAGPHPHPSPSPDPDPDGPPRCCRSGRASQGSPPALQYLPTAPHRRGVGCLLCARQLCLVFIKLWLVFSKLWLVGGKTPTYPQVVKRSVQHVLKDWWESTLSTWNVFCQNTFHH